MIWNGAYFEESAYNDTTGGTTPPELQPQPPIGAHIAGSFTGEENCAGCPWTWSFYADSAMHYYRVKNSIEREEFHYSGYVGYCYKRAYELQREASHVYKYDMPQERRDEIELKLKNYARELWQKAYFIEYHVKNARYKAELRAKAWKRYKELQLASSSRSIKPIQYQAKKEVETCKIYR